MNRILFTLLFIPISCYSQQIGKLDFSIFEIDSLSKNTSCLIIYDLGGGIDAKKTNTSNGKEIQTLGTGYCSITPHSYFTDSIRYKTLTIKEKGMYFERDYCKLQRVDYKSKVNYEDKSFDSVDVKFYYNRDKLFYIRYVEKSTDNNIEYLTKYNFFFIDIDLELINDSELKNWLINKNKEIIKYCITN